MFPVRLPLLWLSGLMAVAFLALPSAGFAAPSPTGRTPRLIWTAERQDVLQRMESDYDRGANTLGAVWFKLIKDAAEKGDRYADTGLWATLMYQTTGDTKYVDLAWKKVTGFLGRTDLNGNYGREYSEEQVVIYDWLYPGLSADRRQQFLAHINEMVRQLTTNPSSSNFPVLPSDSDQMTGTYFGIVFLYLATSDHNPYAVEVFNQPYVGGLAPTPGTPRGTMRNAMKDYVEVLAKGGEWMESSEYNLGTVRLLLMGAEGVRTATGQEHFPEIRQFIKSAAVRPMNFATTNLNDWFEWGDTEEPRKFRGHLYAWITTGGMLSGLLQTDPALGPPLQDHLLDLVEKYGATGYNSAEPWARTFLMFNPYATRGDRTKIAANWYAPGQGILFARDGWDDQSSTFFAHFRPKQDTVHHEVSTFGDFQLYRKGAWGVTHPLTYAGPSLSGHGSNSMTIGTFSAAIEARTIVAEETQARDFAYLAGTTGGQVYSFSYYDPPPTFMHEWTRSLVYLPSTNRSVDTVVIYDRVHAHNPVSQPKFNRYRANHQTAIQGAPGLKQWFFHMPVEPTLTRDAVTWQTPEGQHVSLTNVSGVSLQREVQNQAEIWATERSVREQERKWQVRLIPTEDRPWDTLLQVMSVSDSAAGATSAGVRSGGGEAEGVVVKRAAHPDTLLMFNSVQGALLPGPQVVSGKRTSAATFNDTLTDGRLLKAGYTVTWTAAASSTQVLLFDLDRSINWTAQLDGRPVSLTITEEGGVGRLTAPGAGSHTLQVSASGTAPRPAAPRNVRVTP